MKVERTEAWWLGKANKEGDLPIGAVGGGSRSTLTDAEFDEIKKRFPRYVADDDRPLEFPALMRLIEDRIAKAKTG